MKKYLAIIWVALLGISCESNTYDDLLEEEVPNANITYTANVKSIIDGNCTSCHAPGGAASFRPLTSYAEVKDAIQNTNLLDRIQKQNGEPGLMPQSGRMPQDKINTIVAWNAQGLPEN
jgi:uncharacterized membrane protein